MNALYTQKYTIYTLNMELKKLSEVVAEVGPKNIIRYVKAFRDAVTLGEFDAAELAERFKTSAHRDAPDYAIEYTDAFKRWHATAVLKAQTSGDQPTFDELRKGKADFKAHAKATRERLIDVRERSAKSNAKRRGKVDTGQKDEGGEG